MIWGLVLTVIVVFLLVVWSLCRAAALGDEQARRLAERHDAGRREGDV